MTDLPVKHLWERHMLDDEHVCCYSSTPSPGSEWVWGHDGNCDKGLFPECGDHFCENCGDCLHCHPGPECHGSKEHVWPEPPPCTCPHSTMQVIAVPAGTVGMGKVVGSELMQWYGSVWTLSLSDEWREAWVFLRSCWYPLDPPDGPVFLLRREEECSDCGGTGKTRLKLKCATCNGTGTVVTHRLERGEVLDDDWYGATYRRSEHLAADMDLHKYDALLFTPTLQSWESGEVGDWFQVERGLLG